MAITTTGPQYVLLLDGSRGIYIPQQFAEIYGSQTKGIDPGELAALATNKNQSGDYWEAWVEVLKNATVSIDGRDYTLEQDGDLWAVPVGYEQEEE